MIKKVGSLYTSESLPGKFYLTRKEIVAALKDEDLSELTDSTDILKGYEDHKKLEKEKKLEEIGAEKLVKHAEDLGHRVPEYEPIIIKDPKWAWYYAWAVINNGSFRKKERWLEAEENIKKDPVSAYRYAERVINGRWPEVEPLIAKDPEIAYEYLNNVINKIWEDKKKIRWPEAEDSMKTNPKIACNYARDIIGGRWLEAEPFILTSPEWAFYYTIGIINKNKKADERQRWPEAEKIISTNPEYAYRYAEEIMRKRWLEAEPTIRKDEEAWANYVVWLRSKR